MMPPARRHILMTTDAVGGVWTYATTLAAALARQGDAVTLVTLGPPPRADQLAVLAGGDDVRVEITDFALEWMDPEGKDFARARDGLSALAARLRPDVVHLNGYREALADWPAPVLVVAHSCVRSWWRTCRGEEPAEARWHPYIENVRLGLDAADGWVAPTAAFRDIMQQLYAPRRPGIPTHHALPRPAIAIAPKQPFILAAGRLWDEAKNIRALLSIARGLPWPVKLAGAERCADNAIDLPESVEALGDVPHDDLLALMQGAGLYVAPALYEPFGLAVLEAAASRCALILADVDSLRELWNGAALFVDPRDPQALAAAIRQVCADDAMRARLQRAAMHRAARHSVAAMTEHYSRLYQRLIEQGRSPGRFQSERVGMCA